MTLFEQAQKELRLPESHWVSLLSWLADHTGAAPDDLVSQSIATSPDLAFGPRYRPAFPWVEASSKILVACCILRGDTPCRLEETVADRVRLVVTWLPWERI